MNILYIHVSFDKFSSKLFFAGLRLMDNSKKISLSTKLSVIEYQTMRTNLNSGIYMYVLIVAGYQQQSNIEN